MPVFQQLGASGNPFLPRNQDAFDLLSRITAVEKAQSVPYIKLWRVKPDGTPYHTDPHDKNQPDSTKTVSILMIQPPSFGSSVQRYPERPPVSLDKVTVKNNFQLGGPILYREITLEMVVHRPELVFDESNQDYDQWAALILPGAMFALKYGWQGTSQNDIINGNGLIDANNVVEGQKLLLFVVTRYGFNINPDGSINFTIYAHENCDNILNHISMGDLDYFSSPNPTSQQDVDMYSLVSSAVKQFQTQTGATLIKKLQSSFDSLFSATDGSTGKTPKHGRWVKLQAILDNVFAPLMDAALRSVGYQDVQLFVGNFNDKLGLTKPEHGSDLHGKSIGEFQIPERWLRDTLGSMRAGGMQMNLYNFFSQLMTYVMSAENWQSGLTEDERQQAIRAATGNDGKVNKKQQAIEEQRIINERQSPPEIKIRTASAMQNGKNTAYLYVYDMKRSHTKVDTSDRLNPRTTREEIVQKCNKYGIPIVTLKSGLSFIEGGGFTAEQDPQVQAVLINRALDPSRYQVTNVTHAARAADTVDPRKLLFSSAIQGKISMVGNFVFETFMMIWIEFGVRRWDGTFFVFEKEDVIDRSSFISNVTVRATGDDPLNTQGVLQADQNVQA